MTESRPTPEMHPMSDLKDFIVTPEQLLRTELERQIRQEAHGSITQVKDVNAIREGLPLNVNLLDERDDEKEQK